jgi:hypothetical protein
MDLVRRPLLRWLLLLTLLLGMAVPTTLWRAHALQHGADGIAASDPHIHMPDGSVVAADSSVPDDGAEAHDHMPGVMAGQQAIPGTGLEFHAPTLIATSWFILTIGRLPIESTYQLRRPPRVG